MLLLTKALKARYSPHQIQNICTIFSF